MKNVKTLPEFAGLSELEVSAALDAYDDSVEEAHSSCGGCEGDDTAESPVVAEVFRLIRAYTQRLDELVEEQKTDGNVPENFLADVLSYEPQVPIERAAFDFVADAFMDQSEDGDD